MGDSGWLSAVSSSSLSFSACLSLAFVGFIKQALDFAPLPIDGGGVWKIQFAVAFVAASLRALDRKPSSLCVCELLHGFLPALIEVDYRVAAGNYYFLLYEF